MYVQGVSIRRGAAISKKLCGFELSSTQMSRVAAILDEELEEFRQRGLRHSVYLCLDAGCQKLRHNDQVRDIAVLKALGVNKEGYRKVVGEVRWRKFWKTCWAEGLKG